MERVPQPLDVSSFEHAVWSRCANRYADGFGALVSEAIVPLLDAARIARGDRVLDVGGVLAISNPAILVGATK